MVVSTCGFLLELCVRVYVSDFPKRDVYLSAAKEIGVRGGGRKALFVLGCVGMRAAPGQSEVV